MNNLSVTKVLEVQLTLNDLLETFSLAIAVVSIMIGLLLGLNSMRDAATSRKASLFMEFLGRGYDKEFIVDLMNIISEWTWKDPAEFWQKYGPETNAVDYAKFVAVGSFYEGMARLLKKKIIDIDLVPELMAISATIFWKKAKSVIAQSIEMSGRSHGYEYMQYLVEEILKDTQIPES